ncbi:MAG: hypothetical protein MJ126_05845 [Lachnospiraceae bacterium]|nr:hypothetical protein [Lachnospiraceae bacterium]
MEFMKPVDVSREDYNTILEILSKYSYVPEELKLWSKIFTVSVRTDD